MTFLRRQIRERDAREILLTGEIISAGRAHEIGLVNRVAPTAGAALDEARRLAEAVREGAPLAVSRTKALLAELWHRPVKADLDRALAAHLEARDSAEAAEGIAAYREKRRPKWAPGPAPQRLA
jgi:enoyl-CoA hydratase/carnithine racemase